MPLTCTPPPYPGQEHCSSSWGAIFLSPFLIICSFCLGLGQAARPGLLGPPKSGPWPRASQVRSQVDQGLEASLRGPQSPPSVYPVCQAPGLLGLLFEMQGPVGEFKSLGCWHGPHPPPPLPWIPPVVLCQIWEFPGHIASLFPPALVLLVYTEILLRSSKPRVPCSPQSSSTVWPEATSAQSSSLGKGFSLHGLSSEATDA